MRTADALQQVRSLAAQLCTAYRTPDRKRPSSSALQQQHRPRAFSACRAVWPGVLIGPLAEQCRWCRTPVRGCSMAVEADALRKMILPTTARAWQPRWRYPSLDGARKGRRAQRAGSRDDVRPCPAARRREMSMSMRLYARVGPEHSVKIVFTTPGSTANPKVSQNDAGMPYVNPEQIVAAMPVVASAAAEDARLAAAEPRLWRIQFQKSHARQRRQPLPRRGTKTDESGVCGVRPQHPASTPETPPVYVPIGFAQLVAAMERSEALRRAYLWRLRSDLLRRRVSHSGDLVRACRSSRKRVRGGNAQLISADGACLKLRPPRHRRISPSTDRAILACLCRR